MLSYQHIYHAGNRADVHKHLWLIAVLDYLRQKDKPLTWIDTHAGRGTYDLQTPEAQKLAEFKDGIVPALEKMDADAPPVKIYRDLIGGLNKGGNLHTYPGSARIAASLLRQSDHLHAFELHPGEFMHLERALRKFKFATARKEDGLKALLSLIPPHTKRGGVLIDPSYEIKTEYSSLADALGKAVKKWPLGVYMLWYPMLKAGLFEDLKTRVAALHDNHVIDEWIWGAPESTKGMYGSGMIILNPPYTTAETMQAVKKRLL